MFSEHRSAVSLIMRDLDFQLLIPCTHNTAVYAYRCEIANKGQQHLHAIVVSNLGAGKPQDNISAGALLKAGHVRL